MDMLHMSKNSQFSTSKKKAVYAIFLMTIWYIWKAQKDVIFSNKNKDRVDILGEIKSLSFL